ncbi:MAG: acyltransferase family protein [Marinifilaceae bacterium]
MGKMTSVAAPNTKPHYLILDGLRGVAALMVIWYHIFEGYATSPMDQVFNHGYLAVDFFFLLSGFVIAYAYDDRWKTMSKGEFFKRRLIRLQPMVILGAVLGVITFCIQGGEQWDGTKIAFSAMMFSTLLTMFLIPALPGSAVEVRGNGEMFPLNGPTWSLFFEYIGNILYALFLRRLSTKLLAGIAVLAGGGLITYASLNLSGYGNLGVGWTLAGYGLLGGLLRFIFSFTVGLLIARNFKSAKIKNAFAICTLSIITLLSIPFIGGSDNMWLNGLYDCVCIIALFPVLLYIGASGSVDSPRATKVYKFLGDISYPLYVVHYPFMYLFYSWLWKNEFTFNQTWQVTFPLFIGCIALAYVSLRFYDMPVRRWLTKKFLSTNDKAAHTEQYNTSLQEK